MLALDYPEHSIYWFGPVPALCVACWRCMLVSPVLGHVLGHGHAVWSRGLVAWSGHLVMLPVTVTVRLFASGCRATGCFSVIR